MTTTQADDHSDLGALAGILRRRAWLIVVSVVVAVAAALFYSNSQPTQYQSTAVLLFRQVLLDVQVTGGLLQLPSSDATVESATDVGLISQENVRAAAAQQLGSPYTADSLNGQVNISPQGKSDLVGVQATGSTPVEAARIANTVAAAYIRIADQQIVSEITAAEDRVRSQVNINQLRPSQRATLQAALTKLSVLASLGPDNVHLVQPAVPPSSPSSPKPVQNAVLGGIVGIVIGLALAFGTEQFDRRLRRVDEVERETGLPLLAAVPRSQVLRRPIWDTERLDASDTEPFRRLASSLRHLAADSQIRSVLITSPGPGSGKTTVALHLAAAAAGGLGSKVFLIEADLRRPRLASLLSLPADHGLTTLLQRNGAGDPAAIQSVKLRAGEPGTNGHDGASHEALSVLLAGPRSENATSLLESDKLRGLMRSWRGSYELIVVDGPPPGFVADAIPLAKEVDAVILVARLGKDTGPGIRRLRVELERLGIEPIGVVANFGRRVKNPYASSKR